jgi:DNA polymerase III alpha subunit
MVVDEYGTVGYTQQEVIDYLRINPNFDITGLFITDGQIYSKGRTDLALERTMPEISLWEDRSYDFDVENYHKELQRVWLMPDEYLHFYIQQYILSKCVTQIEVERVHKELALYEKYNLMDLLRYLRYLKDTADKNGIVWGVGRGSSCCSYCLYLMGIHRVDSLKYNLDISEFLR